MGKAINYAKFFIKRGLDSNRNTYDGNMKLQKLLFFANFISLAKRGVPLFDDEVLAFQNGCVVEPVRLRYKNDFAGLLADSREYSPDFSQEEYDIINLTADIFSELSARELSELNHTFDFWKNAYERSMDSFGYKDKQLSVVSNDEMLAEKDKIEKVINAYNASKSDRTTYELINGVKFYHAPNFEITDKVLSELERFSFSADDNSYSVYSDAGSLVIY